MERDKKYSYTLGQISQTYGDHVSIDQKSKSLRKFGRNDGLTQNVEEQVWEVGGIEVLTDDNTITHFASTDTGDVGVICKLEGFVTDGSGNITFTIQDITLDGQNKTALTTPLCRATRLYNASNVDFSGIIYVSKDVAYASGVPASDQHIKVLPENQQSLKCATSTDRTNYWIVSTVFFSVGRAVPTVVDFKVQIRLKGGTWRTQFATTVNSQQSNASFYSDDDPLVVPPNSDVRVLATSTANNVVVDATLVGVLAVIIPALQS